MNSLILQGSSNVFWVTNGVFPLLSYNCTLNVNKSAFMLNDPKWDLFLHMPVQGKNWIKYIILCILFFLFYFKS